MRPLFRIHLLVIIFLSGFPFSPTFEVFRVCSHGPRLVVCSPVRFLVCGYNTVAAGMSFDWMNNGQSKWLLNRMSDGILNLEELYLHKSCEDSVEFLYTLHPVLLWSHVFTHSSLLASSITAVLLLQLRNSPWYYQGNHTAIYPEFNGASFLCHPGCHPGLCFGWSCLLSLLVSDSSSGLSLFLTVLRNSVLKNVSCSVNVLKFAFVIFLSYIEWGYAWGRKTRDEVPLIRSTY